MNRIAVLVIAGILIASCGSDDPSSTVGSDTRASVAEASVPAATAATVGGFTTISAQDASSVVASPPADLVILDVRTPQEYAEGHLEGAVLVDFYDADFSDQLSQLDPEVPYLVYCQSGNRSGQTLPIMEELGFTSASDIDGGIAAWQSAELPVVVE